MIRTLTIALTLALAACGQGASAPSAAPAAPAAEQAATSADAVTREFLVGSWGDNGDCTQVITYNADGSFRMRDGSTGVWTLEGDRLTMSGENGDFGLQIAKGNETQLLIGQPDGGFGISQRC